MLAGIGFTVSLLIGELAFGAGSDATTTSRSRCLSGSLLAAALAAAVLAVRNRVYRRIAEAEAEVTDATEADIYQSKN